MSGRDFRAGPPRPSAASSFLSPSRVVVGNGASSAIGAELQAVGAGRGDALVIVDAAVLESGAANPAVSSLEVAGYAVRSTEAIACEPTPDVVRRLARGAGVLSVVVGIGGGSTIDAAKLVALASTDQLPAEGGLRPDARLRALPCLAVVPTTAGTGAEATAVAMLWDDGVKRPFVHGSLVPRLAVLDPTLLGTLAPELIAASGLDAISHAVESVLSTQRSPLTYEYAKSALTLLSEALPVAYAAANSEGLAQLQLGAFQAGLALNASVVVGHSLAYVIAARTGLSHGVTCAMALPFCMAYCRSAAEATIADVSRIVGAGVGSERAVTWVQELNRSMRIPLSLREVGLGPQDLTAMVTECMASYPRPNCPVPLEAEALTLLLEMFLDGDAAGAWQLFRGPINSPSRLTG